MILKNSVVGAMEINPQNNKLGQLTGQKYENEYDARFSTSPA
jgi:hypothetical protein